MTEKLLRRKEVESLTGLARSTIYLRMAEGSFPRPVRLGKRAVAWPETRIDEWIRQRAPAE